VHGDPNAYRFILNTLISNAVKFTEQGTISITVEEAESRVRISVSDTGSGMSPEAIERLFEWDRRRGSPGTRQEQGAGMGLMLLKDIVESQGGTIQVTSSEGQGTTFVVEMPKLEE
jgi:signal transduction histidine kinase